MTADAQRTERLLTWLEAVDEAWADAGLSRVERRRLGHELEGSIVEGLDSGASEEDFVGDEPATVAADIAAANGYAPAVRVSSAYEEPTRQSFRRTALIGAPLGGLVGWIVVTNLPSLYLFDPIGRGQMIAWVVLVYAVLLACLLAGPAIAIRRRFRRHPLLRRLQVLAVLGVFGGALLAAVPCWAVARALGYPSMSIFVLPEVLLGLAICAVTLDLAWRRGWDKPTP